MALSLVIAPDPIFKKKALPVIDIGKDTLALIQAMFDTMRQYQAVGLGANMVGVLKRVIVIDLTGKNPVAMINPEITFSSDATQVFEEASLSFPGISAKITRPKTITVRYQDEAGTWNTCESTGWEATVIQHEIDYLNGKVFLDYLPKIKQKLLLQKIKSPK